jgi:hypothetical protein
MAMRQANKKKVVGYLTSRPPPLGLLIVLAIAVLGLFTIMSVYFAIASSGNPAAIMMIFFFGVPLLFIIGIEENAFPDLPKRKWKSVVLFYFTVLFVIPMIGSLFVSFNIALTLTLIIFGIPMAFATIHMASTEAGWYNFRVRSRTKLSNAGSKISNAGEKIKSVRYKLRREPKRRLRRNR